MCLTEITLLPRELLAGRDHFPAENSLPMGISGMGLAGSQLPGGGKGARGMRIPEKR